MSLFKSLAFFGITLILFSGCTWPVYLLIGNNSGSEILVEYQVNSNAESPLRSDPILYNFDQDLKNLQKVNTKLVGEPVKVRTLADSITLEVLVKHGKALHIGTYSSFQSRKTIIENSRLRIKLANDSTLHSTAIENNFKHWENMNTDLIVIK